MKYPEFILAIDSNVVKYNDNCISNISISSNVGSLAIRRREELEENSNYRQLIPYVVLRHNGKVAVYRRMSKDGESRLLGMASIGFGGHIDLLDIHHENGVLKFYKTIMLSARRELVEECGESIIEHVKDFKVCTDKIALGGDGVSRRHLAIVIYMDLATLPEVMSLENGLEFIGWYSPDQVNSIENLETWSKIIVNNYADISS